MLRAIAGLALILIGTAAATPIASLGFSLTGVNRFVTPNGDTHNDAAFFRYDNPQDVAGSIRIYELSGRHVATVTIDVGPTCPCVVSWDPRGFSNGIYIYVLSIGESTRSGALVVVR